MNKEEFIDTLQACYFGDRGAFNKIVNEYEELKEDIDKLTSESTEWEDRYYRLQDKWDVSIIELENKNKELHNKIDKAIKYMDNTFNISSVKDMLDIMNRLEEILKDSDVDE